MTPGQALDLGAPPYWFVVMAAIVVVVPLVHPRVRAIAIAAVDLGFAGLCVGTSGLPWLGGLLVGLFAIGHLVARARGRWVALVGAGAGLAALFVLHKRPELALPAGVRGTLTALGFSYVALRAVELLRAVAERRHPPPTLPGLISYLLPFHMLAAGPIQAYDEYRAQPPVSAALTGTTALAALDRIANGLFKKFVIAQAVHDVLLTGFTADGPYRLVEVQAYYLWVYLDFSAYSDIAVGIGMLLGRATPENFANPLGARNITEFWERWHISLSLFIRRNLFFPIQLALGRRTDGARPLAVAMVAITVAFLACGLWHGLSLRFLAWGGLHAAGLVATHLYRHVLLARLGRRGLKRYLSNRVIRVIATVATFEFIAFSLAFSAAP